MNASDKLRSQGIVIDNIGKKNGSSGVLLENANFTNEKTKNNDVT